MTFSTESDSTFVPELGPQLDGYVKQVGGVISQFAEAAGCPDVSVTVVWVSDDDFAAAVQVALDGAESSSPPFTTDRLGGSVMAKNISTKDDHSVVTIVMNTQFAAPSGHGAAHAFFLLAHEMVHPLLSRLRTASGALDGVVFPSYTPVEMARSMTRTVIDEMRADLVANALLGGVFTCDLPSGGARELTMADLLRDIHSETFGDVLRDHVWPGWPDAVERYRHHDLSLQDLLRHLLEGTDQTLTLLAHTEACARSGGDPDLYPFAADRAEHRGSVLYLREMWEALMDADAEFPMLPSLAEFREAEAAVLDAGEAAILAMWGRLGLTFDSGPDRGFHAHVTSPQR